MDRLAGGALDYLLTHFLKPIFPRTISTKATDKRQIPVYNREEVLERYKQASWYDCRISAFPSYTEYKGVNRQAPNFIFIDLDRATFKTEKAHVEALSKTLDNIKQRLGGSPTVLWSGNGYHIYQPVEAFILEEKEIFAKFENINTSRRFIQFAESSLSDGKADRAHNMTVSFKNCMLRVPCSINSKNGQSVKVLQRWDKIRPAIDPLLEDFYVYLSALRIKKLMTPPSNESYYQGVTRYMRFKR